MLVTDASSLAARQAVTALGARGARIELLDSGLVPIGRFSRFVRWTYRVPPYGRAPLDWLEAAMRVLARGRHDVLFAVHEQTAVLSYAIDRVRAAGVGVAVPPFAAVRALQDKGDAVATLDRIGLRQPPTTVAGTPEDALRAGAPPVYVKARIGTASRGVVLARDRAELRAAVDQLRSQGAFDHGGVLLQEPVDGGLLMVQAVFDHGTLVAHHVNASLRAGVSGGSSLKESVSVPTIESDLVRLGGAVGWHGALSLDALTTPAGPCYIDVNPRLVEPGNAQRAGVDLVGRLLDLALGRPVATCPPGRPGVRTHQLLLALLAAAQEGRGRRGVAAEMLNAARHDGPYAGSHEELTALAADPVAAVPLAAVAGTLMVRPSAHELFARGAVDNYALTAPAWRAIVDAHDAHERALSHSLA